MGRCVLVCRHVAAAVHGAEGERRGVARVAAAPQGAPRPARLHTQLARGDYTGCELISSFTVVPTNEEMNILNMSFLHVGIECKTVAPTASLCHALLRAVYFSDID